MTLKEKLQKILKAKQERKAELGKKAKETDKIEELRSINSELEVLNGEIEEIRDMINSIPDEKAGDEGNEPTEGEEGEQREQQIQQPINGAQILGTYGLGGGEGQTQRSADRYSTPEYRSAFMDYVTKNERSDALEFRADTTTGVGDVGAVIPTTIMNKIIEKMNTYGQIWNRVTKTSFKGGLDIPVSNLKPVATWTSGNAMSDKQKKVVNGSVNFKYHKLQCRVAVDLIADTVSMSIFEQTITDNIYEAMIMALEQSIINGSGSGQPLGIVNDTEVTEKVEVKAEDAGKFNTWTEIISHIPLAFESRVAIIMTKVDWDKYILGMTDVNGQPVGRVNYGIDGAITRKLLGYDVILVEGYLPTVDAAESGKAWGIICDLKDYIVNSNLQMTYKRYFDEDTDEWISKSTLIADGKLGDKQGVVLLTKKATV
jgi:HK97 family phage major capsid protein